MSQSHKAVKGDALFENYVRADVTLVRGEGVWAYDAEDNAWLDFGSGIAVNALGHAHPRLVAALEEQAGARSASVEHPTSAARLDLDEVAGEPGSSASARASRSQQRT